MQIPIRQKNSKVTVFRTKIILFLSILTLSSFSGLFAQQVTTEVPSTVISVGYNSEQFSVIITSISAISSGMTVAITQPAGMNIDPSGYAVSINGTASTNFTVSGKTVTIGDAIPANGKVLVNYSAYSTCDIVTSLYDPSVPITLTDKVVVYANGLNTTATTDYYNVKFPDLLVQAPGGSRSTKQVVWGQLVNRILPIRNGAGAGICDNVVFSITHDNKTVLSAPAGSIAVDSVNGPWIALPAPVISADGKYSFTISSADFAALGLGATFDGGELFFFKETDKVVLNKANLRTDYQATWMANAVNCGSIRNNSKGSLYLTQQILNSSLTIGYGAKRPNMCQTQGFDTLTFTNNGTAPDFDIIPNVYSYGAIKIKGATYKGLPITFTTNGGSTTFQLPATDGTAGGFTDLNGSGRFDDLAVGESASIIVEIEYPAASSGFLPAYQYLYLYGSYTTVGATQATTNYIYLADNDGSFAGTPTGVLDLMPNVKSLFGIDGYSVYDSYHNISDTCNRGSYFLTAELPAGVTYDPLYAAMVGGVRENVTQSGNLLTISGNQTDKVIFPTAGNVSVQLIGSCAVTNGPANITWTLYRQCGSCDPVALGSKTYGFELHGCDTLLPGCLGVTRPVFSANRLTLGYDASTHTGLWHVSDMVPANKISPSKADLKQALVTDTVLFTLTDTISLSCQPDALSATFVYRGHSNLFVNESAVFVMNGTSFALSNPTVSSTGGFNYITYSIPRSLVGSFASGAIAVNAKVIIPDSTISMGDNISVDYMKAKLGISYEGTDYGINSYGDHMLIHYPNQSVFQNWDNNMGLCATGRTTRFSNPNTFVLPNEFRSIFHLNELVYTFPVGYKIDPSAFVISYYNALTDVSTPITAAVTVTASADGQQVTLTGNWPLVEESYAWNYSFININYSVVPTADAPCTYGTIKTSVFENDYRYPALNTATPTPNSNNTWLCVYGPEQSLTTEVNQPGYSSSVTWRMYVKNNNIAAPNTWLAFKNGVDNIAHITIKQVKVNGVKINNPITTIANGAMFINVGNAVTANTTNVIDVSASYSNCGSDNVDSLYVTGGASCQTLTSLDSITAAFSGVLTLTDKAADMQAEAWEVNPKEYDMCDTILYKININSSSLGSMYKMGFWETLPEQLQMAGDVKYSYTYYGQLLTGTLSDVVTESNVIVSKNILIDRTLDDGFPGLGDTIRLTIPVKLKCSGDTSLANLSDVHAQLKFNLAGQTNCGSDKAYIMPFTPKVKGFSYIDSIKILRSSGTDFSVRHGQSDMTITIKNNSSAFVDSVYLQAVLPVGFNYVPLSTGPLAIEPTQTVTAAGTILIWELPKGQYMKPHDSLTLHYKIVDATTCPPPTASIVSSTFLLRQVGGVCGNACTFKGTTDIDTSVVGVKPIGTVSAISGPGPVCQGSPSSILSVEASADYTNFEWGVAPASAGSVVAATDGTSAILSYNAGFAGTATVWMVAQAATCPKNDSLFYRVTVKPLPTLVLSVPDTACNDKRATVSVSGTVGNLYSWSVNPSAGSISGLGDSAIVTFNAGFSGNASVSVSATNNACVASASGDIVVKQCTPVCSVSAGADVATCAGSPVTLTATPSDCMEGVSGCAAEVKSTYTCSSNPITGNVNITINAGQTVYISNFSGNVTMNGGTLVICGNTSNLPINTGNGFSTGTVVVNGGTVSFGNMNINNGYITFKNFGSSTFLNATSNAAIENYKTMTFNGDFSVKNSFLNMGTITAKQSFINNTGASFSNQGILTVNGILHNNSNATLINSCTINADRFINDYVTTNSGTINVTTSTMFNGSSIYNASAGSMLQTQTFSNDNVIKGDAASCATIKITGSASCNSSKITGIIDVCGVTTLGNSAADSKVVFGCGCKTGTSGIKYAWSPVSGLSNANSATPTVTNPQVSTTYTVTVTDAKGNTGTDEVTVTVTSCSHITVTPNPFTQYITVKATTPANEYSAMVNVFNGQGVKVYSQGIQTNTGQQIYLNWFSAGTYTIQVVTNGYTESVNVIKN